MRFHEYQVKELFRQQGIPVQNGAAVYSGSEALSAAEKLGGSIWAVKAQVLAGGRGLAGGVKIASTPDEVREIADRLIGSYLVTPQTDSRGEKVNLVYVECGAEIQKEYYLSIVMDRGSECPVFIASAEGGTDIEKTAKENPAAIAKVAVDPLVGVKSFHLLQLAECLGIAKDEQKSFYNLCKNLYELFRSKDAEFLEINPLVKTAGGQFVALDGKMSIDDNAAYRHKELTAQADTSSIIEAEKIAKENGFSYVQLDGNVGCMVNGAGLAMATMDLIKAEGGEPANFLDVGGNASAESVAKGFKLILTHSAVKAIFVNIFGGIVRCDRVANGIIEATQSIQADVPIIVRLAGTNANEAADILSKAGLPHLIAAQDFGDGAKKAVREAGRL